MYSLWAFSFAQVEKAVFLCIFYCFHIFQCLWAPIFLMLQMTIEIPYILLQAILFGAITYPAIDFYWSAAIVFWYFYTMFCTMLYFTFLGMLLIAITQNVHVASVSASFCYTMLTLFSVFVIPGPVSKPNPFSSSCQLHSL